MKIALVSKQFPPDIRGGGEVSAYYLAEALSDLAEVYVVTSRGISSNFLKFEVHPVIKNRKLPGILNYVSRNEIFYYDTYRALIKFLKELDIDVLHALNMDTIPGTIAAAKKFKIPCVITVSSQYLTCPQGYMLNLKDTSVCDGECNFIRAAKCYYYSEGAQKILGPLYYPFQMHLRRKAGESADAIICLSENIKNYIVKLYPHKKIAVIPNIVKIPTHAEKRTESDILYVGALGKYKGCEYLIDAMKYIIKEFPQCRLKIMGSGPDSDKMQKLSRSLGLEKNISFGGFVPHTELAGYYASTRIVVFPSVVPETFGRIAAEAMAAGKPVIGARSGGIPEIVRHMETGMLVNPKSAKEIADAAVYLLRHQDKIKYMGESGKKLIEEMCSPSIIAGKHFKLYEEVISNGN